MKRAASRAAAWVAALALAGCGTMPPPVPTAPGTEDAAARMPAPASAFERRLVDTLLPDRLQRGAQALKRGDLDAAAVQYLGALSLQPDHAQAADALRQIERERNKRSYLGKHSRLTLTRRAVTEAQMANPAPAVPLDRNEVEHAAMLATQGELDDAIALLERHLSIDKRDAAACQLLADVYFQKAEKQLPRDRAAALVSFEKGMRLDAGNPRVTARLKPLKNGNGNGTSGASGCASRAL